MSEAPRPVPPPQGQNQSAQTPQQQQTQPAPTPASVSGDVPVEAWRSRLAETKEAPAAERHERLGALLDDLDAQVGSL
jgi:hypothetical protein